MILIILVTAVGLMHITDALWGKSEGIASLGTGILGLVYIMIAILLYRRKVRRQKEY